MEHLAGQTRADHVDEEGQHTDDDEDVCRICRTGASETSTLYHPCKCVGSIRYVHQKCLEDWLRVSKRSHCEVCQHSFQFVARYAPGAPRVLPPQYLLAGLAAGCFKVAKKWPRYALAGLAWLVAMPLWTTLCARAALVQPWWGRGGSSWAEQVAPVLSERLASTSTIVGDVMLGWALCVSFLLYALLVRQLWSQLHAALSVVRAKMMLQLLLRSYPVMQGAAALDPQAQQQQQQQQAGQGPHAQGQDLQQGLAQQVQQQPQQLHQPQNQPQQPPAAPQQQPAAPAAAVAAQQQQHDAEDLAFGLSVLGLKGPLWRFAVAVVVAVAAAALITGGLIGGSLAAGRGVQAVVAQKPWTRLPWPPSAASLAHLTYAVRHGSRGQWASTAAPPGDPAADQQHRQQQQAATAHAHALLQRHSGEQQQPELQVAPSAAAVPVGREEAAAPPSGVGVVAAGVAAAPSGSVRGVMLEGEGEAGTKLPEPGQKEGDHVLRQLVHEHPKGEQAPPQRELAQVHHEQQEQQQEVSAGSSHASSDPLPEVRGAWLDVGAAGAGDEVNARQQWIVHRWLSHPNRKRRVVSTTRMAPQQPARTWSEFWSLPTRQQCVWLGLGKAAVWAVAAVAAWVYAVIKLSRDYAKISTGLRALLAAEEHAERASAAAHDSAAAAAAAGQAAAAAAVPQPAAPAASGGAAASVSDTATFSTARPSASHGGAAASGPTASTTTATASGYAFGRPDPRGQEAESRLRPGAPGGGAGGGDDRGPGSAAGRNQQQQPAADYQRGQDQPQQQPQPQQPQDRQHQEMGGAPPAGHPHHRGPSMWEALWAAASMATTSVVQAGMARSKALLVLLLYAVLLEIALGAHAVVCLLPVVPWEGELLVEFAKRAPLMSALACCLIGLVVMVMAMCLSVAADDSLRLGALRGARFITVLDAPGDGLMTVPLSTQLVRCAQFFGALAVAATAGLHVPALVMAKLAPHILPSRVASTAQSPTSPSELSYYLGMLMMGGRLKITTPLFALTRAWLRASARLLCWEEYLLPPHEVQADERVRQRLLQQQQEQGQPHAPVEVLAVGAQPPPGGAAAADGAHPAVIIHPPEHYEFQPDYVPKVTALAALATASLAGAVTAFMVSAVFMGRLLLPLLLRHHRPALDPVDVLAVGAFATLLLMASAYRLICLFTRLGVGRLLGDGVVMALKLPVACTVWLAWFEGVVLVNLLHAVAAAAAADGAGPDEGNLFGLAPRRLLRNVAEVLRGLPRTLNLARAMRHVVLPVFDRSLTLLALPLALARGLGPLLPRNLLPDASLRWAIVWSHAASLCGWYAAGVALSTKRALVKLHNTLYDQRYLQGKELQDYCGA